MENKKTVIIVSLTLIFMLVGGSILYKKVADRIDTNNLVVEEGQGTLDPEAADSVDADKKPTGTETQVQAAPDITFYDYDGNPVNLSDFKGKPVILNFWASWCGPCKSEMPDFDDMYQKYGNDIHFLMVNMTDGSQETEEKAKKFIADSGYTFPVYFDLDQDAAYTYGVYSIPTTYFIDTEGNLVAQGSGALDLETLKTGIGMIYNK